MARGRENMGPRVPGIVLEVTGRSAMVLAEGRFLRVPAIPGWEAGEEIWVAPPSEVGWSLRLRRRVGAALVVCVAVASGSAFWAVAASAQVAAVVSVDINPSVDMTVDAHGRVLRAQPLDADAARILAQGPLTALPLQQAVETVVKRAVADGYLSADPGAAAPVMPVILVAAAPAHKGDKALPPPVADAMAQAQAQVQTILQQQHVTATVAVAQAPESDLRAANKAGLSVGKYELYRDVKAAGATTAPDAWRSQTVEQALTGAGVPQNDVSDVVAAIAKHAEPEQVIRDAQQGDSAAALEHILRASEATSNGDSAGAAAASMTTDGGSRQNAQQQDNGSRSSSTGQARGSPPPGTPGAATSSAGSQGTVQTTSATPVGFLQRIEQQLFGSHSTRGGDGDSSKQRNDGASGTSGEPASAGSTVFKPYRQQSRGDRQTPAAGN